MKNRYNSSFAGRYELAVATVKLPIKNCIFSYIQISYLAKNQKKYPLRVYTFRFLLIEKSTYSII